MSAIRSAMYAPAMWNGGYLVTSPAIGISYCTSPCSSSFIHVTISLMYWLISSKGRLIDDFTKRMHAVGFRSLFPSHDPKHVYQHFRSRCSQTTPIVKIDFRAIPLAFPLAKPIRWFFRTVTVCHFYRSRAQWIRFICLKDRHQGDHVTHINSRGYYVAHVLLSEKTAFG